jgi:hypothetical protein
MIEKLVLVASMALLPADVNFLMWKLQVVRSTVGKRLLFFLP